MQLPVEVDMVDFPLVWEGVLMWIGGRAAVRLLHVDGDDLEVMLTMENMLLRRSEWAVVSGDHRAREREREREREEGRGEGEREREREKERGRHGGGAGGGSLREECKRAFGAARTILCSVISGERAPEWWGDTFRGLGSEEGLFQVDLPTDSGLCGVLVPRMSELHRHLTRGHREPLVAFWLP